MLTAMTDQRSWLETLTRRTRPRQRFRNAVSRLWERWLRIETVWWRHPHALAHGHWADSEPYESVDYPRLRHYLKVMRLGADDVVFDIGCGKGRALCLFARQRVRQCIGLELDEQLAACARANLARLRGRHAPAQVIQGDAAFADYTQGTVFYLYNPFGEATLRAVLERLHASLLAHPRPIRLFYLNCVHEQMLRQTPWLHCVVRRQAGRFQPYAFYAACLEPAPPPHPAAPACPC